MFTKLAFIALVPAALIAQQPSDSTRAISLGEAIRLTKDNNFASINAQNSIRNANLSIRSSRAQLYPSLTATAGQTKQGGERVDQTRGTVVPYSALGGATIPASAPA